MVKQGIQIFARVKPTKAKTGPYDIFDDEGGNSYVEYTVPRDLADGYINNKREVYKFRFNRVFDQQCSQDEVFDNVARGVADSVLSGYNGTIFAYGQTGSGKTFTITGGPERYEDRGLIPRTLSYMYEYFEKHPDNVYTVHISYLEIYNNSGYDLLDPKHEACKLEDLPKVTLLEDSDDNVHLKNLSLHQASSEEDALNLLFLGDTNRMIAETPMNQASTRSHCIFTIHVSTRETGKATIRRAKLHLVDLAGSERVGKTGVGGTQLAEAKYINLSLHFLEQVIVALSEKSRSHIPYRNSMMTSVLRDSLGGNCMTTMIATCAVERKNIDESISTCRFAQRVALIKNDALLNEEVDPKLMISQLKREVQQLKTELAMATGQEYTGELGDDEYERLRRLVKSYIEDTDPEAVLSVGADMRKIDYCFKLLKEHVLERPSQSTTPSRRSNSQADSSTDSSYLGHQTETSKLKELIKQRDNEISILYKALEHRLNCWLPEMRARVCSTPGFATRTGLWESLGANLEAPLCSPERSATYCSSPDTPTSKSPAQSILRQMDENALRLLADLKIINSKTVSHFMDNTYESECDEESMFIRRMDNEALLTLGRLKIGLEGFTLHELKGFHRKARVAVEAGITNNDHIHRQITTILDKHIRVTSHMEHLAIAEQAWRGACQRFKQALLRNKRVLARIEELERHKMEAEQEYVASLREIGVAEQEKRESRAWMEAEVVRVRQPKRDRTVSFMLKKEKKRTVELQSSSSSRVREYVAADLKRSSSQPLTGESSEPESHRSSYRGRGRESFDSTSSEPRPPQPQATPPEERPSSAYNRKLQEMSAGRKEAFEIFKRDYVHNDTIEKQKRDLKQRYSDAKILGEQVNSARLKINKLKTQIEQHRVRKSMQGLVNGTEEEGMDPEEGRLRQAIEDEKARYKQSFTGLRTLKTEIEHLQHFLEKAKVQMQKDFEIWWAEQAAINMPKAPDEVRAAWRTPPLSPIRPAGDNPRPPSASRRHRDPGKMPSKFRAEAQLASSGMTSAYASKLDSADSGRGSAEASYGRHGDPSSSDGGVRRATIESSENGPYPASKSRSAQDLNSGSSIPLTGDSQADADIRAFIKARQNLIEQRGRR